ncbi:hypothetical protein [Haloferula sp. A504]|uniref:hypothetical protein n=1 Tax=Haloferula sp. A504 TaxID=3373601 RepID=UPI0031C8779F|nr:hypothetical protein [Verrucomicrobiaceae bacterium E54]
MTPRIHNTLFFAFVGLFGSAPVGADTVLVDHTFDGVANDIGPAFQQLYNGQGTASTDPSTGYIETTGINNASIGFNTEAAVDASTAAGFTITWVVDSYYDWGLDTGAVGGSSVHYNGWFFGVGTSTSDTGTGLWNNHDSLGLLLDGGNTFSANDWSLAANFGGKAFASLGTPATYASLADGFTVSLTVNSDGTWSASSTGMSTDISATGNLADFTTLTYSDIAGSLVANTTIQGPNPSTTASLNYTVTSVTLTVHDGPSASSDLKVTSITRSGSTVTVEFTGGVDGQTYDLNKSTTLDFTTPDIKDTTTLSGATSGTLEDTTATEDKAFYRVEPQ